MNTAKDCALSRNYGSGVPAVFGTESCAISGGIRLPEGVEDLPQEAQGGGWHQASGGIPGMSLGRDSRGGEVSLVRASNLPGSAAWRRE